MSASGTVRELASARASELGDFTTTWRVVPMSVAAVAIGLLSTCVAWALLRLIGLFTNLFFFQRDKGIGAKYGLDVQIKGFTSGTDAVTSIAIRT